MWRRTDLFTEEEELVDLYIFLVMTTHLYPGTTIAILGQG